MLTPSIPTPSPTESLPVLPPSDEVKTTTEAQGSGQDLTLIWMAISVKEKMRECFAPLSSYFVHGCLNFYCAAGLDHMLLRICSGR